MKDIQAVHVALAALIASVLALAVALVALYLEVAR
jgi:hypothetical protein